MFIGETAVDPHRGAYCFKIVNFQDFTIKQLQFELHEPQHYRDKIIGFNSKNLCIRNNGKLLFGSLILRPSAVEQLTFENHKMSIHKYLLCNSYLFEFFTSELAYYLLQTGRTYCLYQMIVDAGCKLEPLNSAAENEDSRIDGSNTSGRPFAKKLTNEIFEETESPVKYKTPERKTSIYENLDFDQFDPIFRDSVVYQSDRAGFFTQRPTINEAVNTRTSINFNPKRLERIINLTGKEFQEKNSFTSDHDFFDWLQRLNKKLNSDNSSETFQATLNDVTQAIEHIKDHASNFDVPARFIFIELLKQNSLKSDPHGTASSKARDSDSRGGLLQRGGKQSQVTSEIMANAFLSEQQDFIAKCILGDEPKNWNDIRLSGMVYWYSDLAKLKQIVEKGAMDVYKVNKNPWDLLLWLILFNKPKVLSGLFKLVKDQEKFVKFFAEDFSTQQARDKAYNNAFVLRSKKKFEESAAFFILAHQFSEAFDIILNHLKDIQLAILVFRVNEREIKDSESQFAFIKHFFQEAFTDKSVSMSDKLISVVGKMVLGDIEAVVRELKDYETDEFMVQTNEEFLKSYGFMPTSFCLSIQDLLMYMETNPKYKRFIKVDTVTASVKPNLSTNQGSESVNQPRENSNNPNVNDDEEEPDNFDIFDRRPAPVKKPGYSMTIFWDEDENTEPNVQPPETPKTDEVPSTDSQPVQNGHADAEQQKFDINKTKEIQRFNYLTENQKHFLALLEMLAFKANHPESFTEATTDNYYRIKHNIMQITFKKLAKLIKSEKYVKINLIAKDIEAISRYFQIEPRKILKKTLKRIQLINDESLTICFMLATQPIEESVQLLNVYLQSMIECAFRQLKKDFFVLKGANYWMRKLLGISRMSSMLKNVAKVDLETDGSPLYGEMISCFNEVINIVVKVIFSRTMCFEEAHTLLNVKVDLPVMCSEFETLLVNAIKKIKGMHPFSIVHIDKSLKADKADGFGENGMNKAGVDSSASVNQLEQSHLETEKIQRQMFINLNKFQTSSPLNTIISSLGLNDYLTPSNLCLQLLVQIIQINEILSEKKKNKHKLVFKLEHKLERMLFKAQLCFIEVLESNDIETVLELTEELQKLLFLDQVSIKRNLFIYVQPDSALHLQNNDKVLTSIFDLKSWKVFLEDLKTFKLLQYDFKELSPALRNKRKDSFGTGVQVFRPKLENNGFFKNKSFRKLLAVSRSENQELFIWVHRRLRKISLFNSLFKRPRSNAFFTLTFEVG